MKQLFTLFLLISSVLISTAQVNVTSDVNSTWTSYMNVFNNDSGAKGAYVFGNAWSVANLKTTITPTGDNTYSNGAVKIQPNFNGYAENIGDAFWRDNGGSGPGGNKWMEATTKVEIAAGDYSGGDLTFTGVVDANTLDANYTAVAFIKTLNANNFSTVIFETVALGGSGTNFSVTATGINTADIVQYGFIVEGINANPDNEAALGSVIITPDLSVLSVDKFKNFDFSTYPNPVQNTLNVSAGATVDSVSIFDLTGRQVLRATPNAAAFSLDVANLNKGLYLVSLKAGDQEMTTKLVK